MIGPLWNNEIRSRLTEENAVSTCLAQLSDLERGSIIGLEWSEGQLYAEREIRRSVRYIAQAASLLSSEHLLLAFDQLPDSQAGSLPTMERLIDALNEAGHLSARVPDLRPFIATHAPFETVLETIRSLLSTE